MLSEILSEGYFSAVGDDEARLDYISKTADELVELLRKRPEELISFSLLAANPDSKPDDESLKLVEGKLQVHWVTYHNKFPNETPVRLLRGLILECIARAAKGRAEYAAICWYTASTFLKLGKANSEQAFLHNFFRSLGKRVEAAAVKPYSYFRDSRPLIEAIGANTEISVDGSYDHKPLGAAISSLWSTDTNTFDSTKGPAIAKTIGLDVQQLIQTAVGPFETALGAIKTAVAVEILLNKLLWWKETKYSESAGVGYREVSDGIRCLLLVSDLVKLAPELHPQSFEYILREHCAQLFEESKTTLLEAIKKLVVDLKVSEFLHAVSLERIPESGNLLTCFLKGMIQREDVKESDVSKALNLDPTTPVTWPSVAVWIFRELQAYRIVQRVSAKRKK